MNKKIDWTKWIFLIVAVVVLLLLNCRPITF